MESTASSNDLPNELWLDIVDLLSDVRDKIRLMRSSRGLRLLIEPIVYADAMDRQRAMMQGCREGNPDALRMAHRYGAPLDYCLQSDGVHLDPADSPLALAVKRRHSEVIRLLVDLGVRVLRPGMRSGERQAARNAFQVMVRRLCRFPCGDAEEGFCLVRLLYDAAVEIDEQEEQQAAEAGRPSPRKDLLPLNTLIMSRVGISGDTIGPPLCLIKLALDDGADPSEIRSYRQREMLSPLSAAILANSEATFRLLLERGAKVDGIEADKMIKYLPRKGLHIPIFAAASNLANPRADPKVARTLMQLCLESGCDINHRISVVVPSIGVFASPFVLTSRNHRKEPGWKWRRLGGYVPGRYTYATPLLAFLNSIGPFQKIKYEDVWTDECGGEAFPEDGPYYGRYYGRSYIRGYIRDGKDNERAKEIPDPAFVGNLAWLLSKGASYPNNDPLEVHPDNFSREYCFHDGAFCILGSRTVLLKNQLPKPPPDLLARLGSSRRRDPVFNGVDILLGQGFIWDLANPRKPAFATVMKQLMAHLFGTHLAGADASARGARISRWLIQHAPYGADRETHKHPTSNKGYEALLGIIANEPSVTPADLSHALAAFVVSRCWPDWPNLGNKMNATAVLLPTVERLSAAGAKLNARVVQYRDGPPLTALERLRKVVEGRSDAKLDEDIVRFLVQHGAEDGICEREPHAQARGG